MLLPFFLSSPSLSSSTSLYLISERGDSWAGCLVSSSRFRPLLLHRLLLSIRFLVDLLTWGCLWAVRTRTQWCMLNLTVSPMPRTPNVPSQGTVGNNLYLLDHYLLQCVTLSKAGVFMKHFLLNIMQAHEIFFTNTEKNRMVGEKRQMILTLC